MTRRFVSLTLALALLPLASCQKVKRIIHNATSEPVAEATPTPTPAPTPVAVATPEPTPAEPEIDKTASVVVFCYHRFENRPKDALALAPEAFEQQLQQIKDSGFTVVGMQDYLAFRRGEKAIPAKSAVITIDDGYRSAYEVAWPILKKFGYPFTMFIYTNYVKGQPNAGGQSMSWEELEHMRDEGVDIQSHSVSHADLRAGKKGKTDEQYREWLRGELGGSKKMLEDRLGIRVNALAYPYGIHSEIARQVAMEVGYEAAFTVYGQRIGFGGPADILGRYAIDSLKPQIFQAGLNMVGGGAAPTGYGPSSSGPAAPVATTVALSKTQPAEGETVRELKPLISADLSSMGEIDPESIEMRISGFGLVSAKFDAATKMVSYQPTQKLRDKSYTVIVAAKSKGRKVETRWSFNFEAPAAE